MKTLIFTIVATLLFAATVVRADDVAIPCIVDNTNALMVGDIYTCSIEVVTDSDIFTIEAVSGEILRITLTDTTGNGAEPQLELFDCAGTPIDLMVISDTGLMHEIVVPCDGTLTALITDVGNNETGNYNLALQRRDPLPGEAVTVCVDCEIASAISPVGDSDVYTVEGALGTHSVLTIADQTGNGGEVLMEIFDPSGILLNTLTVSDTGLAETLMFASTGTHTLMLSDQGHNETYNYTIALQQLFPIPASAVALNYGETFADAISPVTDTDVLTFVGGAGTLISLTLTDQTGNGGEPVMEVYGPDQELLTTLQVSDTGITEQITLADSGTYTMFLTDVGNNETFNYSITVQCIIGCDEPDIAASPTRINFGNIDVGMTSAARTVTVSNNGSGDLIIANTLASTHNAFTLANDTCSNAIVSAGNNCSFEATFAPISAGRVNGRVSISSNDPDTPNLQLTLIGTGIGAPADPVGGSVFGIGVTSVRCTNQTTGQSVVINTGTADYVCTESGLEYSSSDVIRLTIDGTAN